MKYSSCIKSKQTVITDSCENIFSLKRIRESHATVSDGCSGSVLTIGSDQSLPGMILIRHPLPAFPIKLAVKNLLPGAEIEAALADRDHRLTHHLALHVGVGVVLAGLVVLVAANRFVGGQLFQPALVILVQAALVVVDEDRGRDVHGVYQSVTTLPSLSPELTSLFQIMENPIDQTVFSKVEIARLC